MLDSASREPRRLASAQEAADFLLKRFGQRLRLGTPLGLGKPNSLLNILYDRALRDSSLELRIYTALSLTPPRAKGDLERRFLDPFARRQWGEHYPVLRYAADANRGTLPPNVQLHEFYVQAGAILHAPLRQRHYQSINYTHVPRALAEEGLDAIVQLVARDKHGSNRLSLSCNPDITLDVVDAYRKAGRPLVILGVIHPDLPFLKGEAEVDPTFFEALVEEPAPQTLFALPRSPIDGTDHAIGFYASQTVVDDGTIQIGIGSLSDAIVASLICRQQKNALYRCLVDAAWEGRERPAVLSNGQPFVQGLYGLSEMVMDGFMHLRRHGILKRLVGDGIYLNGAFFLGSTEFYQWLRSLEGDDFTGLRMGRVTGVNDLYDLDEARLREERRNARFFNTCMQVTLLGGAASDTLEDGRVVSGVGGQYNFVAMSHELPDARSVLMLRSTRSSGGKRHSNLVWSHGQLTIPRHLRDVVVTEYGVAQVRGKSDEETIRALLNVCDSAFQRGLLAKAKAAGKVDPAYCIPAWATHNTPERVKALIDRGRREGVFGTFALGSDFTEEEQRLVAALEWLGEARGAWWKMARLLMTPLDETFTPELTRMGLAPAHSLKERFLGRLVSGALRQNAAPATKH